MSQLHAVLDSFAAEGASFRALVASLPTSTWDAPTPAEPWTVRDQVSHVTFVFSLAAAAAADPERFEALTATIGEGGFDAAVNAALPLYNQGTPADILAHYDRHLGAVTKALRGHDPDGLVPWLVKPLPPHVLATAGMVEMFAHGQDIADAAGVNIERTDRVGVLVPFIHRTIDFGYHAAGVPAPAGDFRMVVSLPSGGLTDVGPAEAPNLVCGSAVDLALLATRRRHRDDLALHATGPDAPGYLNLAQAYRGPAGPGRSPASETRLANAVS